MGVLELVSIVPWEIITQLINLLLLFLLLKHFLFKPVQNVLNARQAEIDKTYADAETAQTRAEALRDEYEKRIADAKAEATDIVKNATRKAQLRGEEIVRDAQSQASRLIEKADMQIEQEKKKARNELKDEISGIAIDIASKVVEREIDEKDHETLIAEFIKGVGEAS
ncbi:MAG TPA: F0F1 ATP synthase subunit B [Candidatus Butyricicoccus stercorigallinarum]|nr:F0F1 ATP synthase subunit B [Candidatus Butyricicoccus stercorigallinarum]